MKLRLGGELTRADVQRNLDSEFEKLECSRKFIGAELMTSNRWKLSNDAVAQRLVLLDESGALVDGSVGPIRVSIVGGKAHTYGLESLIPEVGERNVLVSWCLREIARRSALLVAGPTLTVDTFADRVAAGD